MNRETLRNYLIQENLPQDKIETVLDHADGCDIYDELETTGFGSVGQVIAKIREKENTILVAEKNKKHIIEHIRKEMLPHTNMVINTSNIQLEPEDKLEWVCSLKAFSIEYMLKSIEILVNADDINNQRNQSIEELISDFLKKSKERLVNKNPGTYFNGHEINDIFNTLIPQHIKILIKYKSITNSIDPNVTERGVNVRPVTADKSMENFIADYLLAVKDCELSADAYQQDEGFKKNNKAFATYRYINEHAKVSDYNLLNCIMVSTYMTLEYLLEHPEIAKDFSKGQIISYTAISDILSQEEYEHLISHGKENNYDINSLMTYHTFLKHYLKDRTPKMNDERYGRINKLFEEINAADDISTTSKIFGDWFRNIDIKTLSKEEFKELKVIAPEFIYNSLSYEDKLIFKKCQEAGIEFEYYYKLDPVRLEQLIFFYKQNFKGHSIDINLILRKDQHDVYRLINVIKKRGLDIRAIPSYYFKYTSQQIDEAYKTFLLQSTKKTSLPFLSEQSIKDEGWKIISPLEELIARITLRQKKDSSYSSQDPTSFLNVKREYNKKRKEKMIELLELVKIGELNENNYEEYRCDSNTYTRLRIINELRKTYKLDDIGTLLDMGTSRLISIANKALSGICTNTKKNSCTEHQENNADDLQMVIQSLMNNEFELNTHMRYLSGKQVETSYRLVQSEKPDLPIGEYLLYKTPEEVKQIIDVCHEQNIDFEPEFLYFDVNIFRCDSWKINYMVIGAKESSNFPFEYETAHTLSNRIIQEHRKQKNKNLDNGSSSFYDLGQSQVSNKTLPTDVNLEITKAMLDIEKMIKEYTETKTLSNAPPTNTKQQ